MNLSPVFRQRFFDGNGAPLAAGQLFSYAAGTTTPQATYSNATGTANTNPVVLDSQGYADVWLDPTLAYKLVLKDASSSLIWSVDNVQVSITGISTWASTQVYQQGQIVADSGGTGMLYVSLTNSNLNNALTSVSNWRVFNGNIRTVSTSVTLLVTDDLVRSNSTAGNLTQTLPPCSTTPIGKKITVKDVGSGGNTTTVKGSGTDNVDGSNTYALTLPQYASATFINNGTSWDVAQVLPNGSVAARNIAPALSPYLLPSGAILDFGGAAAPTGFLACDGAAVSRTTYAALFTAIGTAWGTGDGTTTFNVPDLRGRATIGSGTGSGLTARTLGVKLGAETASHVHKWHELSAGYEGSTYDATGTIQTDNTASSAGGYASDGAYSIAVQTGGPPILGNAYTKTGGNSADINMQPSGVVQKIIKT